MSLRSPTNQKHLQEEAQASCGTQSGPSVTIVQSVVSQTESVIDDLKDLSIEPTQNKSSNQVETNTQDTTSPAKLEFRHRMDDTEVKAILQGQKRLSNQMVANEDFLPMVGPEKRYI